MNNWRASITTTSESQASWIGYFETEELAQEWVGLQQIKKGRRPERTVTQPVLDEDGEPTFNEVPRVDDQGNPVFVIEYSYDEEGNIIEGSEVITDQQIIDYVPIVEEVTLPSEAVVLIEDISTEAERNKRLENLSKVSKKNNRDLDFGRSIIAFVGMKNEEKNLTHEQKNSMMSDENVQVILTMLQAGRIGYCRQLINNYIPDGILLTTTDKDDIIQLIDDYLAKWS